MSFLKSMAGVLAFVLWISAICVGLQLLRVYDTTPGSKAVTVSQWPAGAEVPAPSRRPELILFVHPQCPCSRATIGELDRLVARIHGTCETYILFERPRTEPSGWERTALWYSAKSITGVHVLTDRDGVEAGRFGAKTSGQALLYSTAGRLVFSGGITPTRGHMGDSDGRLAILDILSGHVPHNTETPVFGCALTYEPINIGQGIREMTSSTKLNLAKDEAPQTRASFLFEKHLDSIYRRTDRMFAVLMVLQWIGGIIAVLLISPRTWNGASSSVHPHLLAAIFLGGMISGLAIYFALVHTGKAVTRHIIAVCQMLTSALFIHYSGGRIETHFHVFGSLAFLAFYRDWRVLLTATVVVAGDHILRGTVWPESVFGTTAADPWRWIEHAAWVIFEDVFLLLATIQSIREMHGIADRQSRLETIEGELTVARDGLEEQVQMRTAELASTNASLHQQIAERERAEEAVVWQAHHDTLTGVPNRTGFLERLRDVIEQARRKQQDAAILFIDLDRFKQINDTFGHNNGDHVLCESVARIQDCLRAEDTLGRLGGDEFAALLPGLSEQDAIRVARTIMEGLSRPMHMDDTEVSVTASIGISLYPDDGDDAEALLKFADAAMYRAKGVGGGFYTVYSEEMTASTRERLELESSLRHAVERRELVLFYQPQVSFTTGEIIGVEALVRWRHPNLGIVPPTKFIPLAEETGLILPIGRWVLEEACRQAVIWRNAGSDLRMSVNLSARQFEQQDLAHKWSSQSSRNQESPLKASIWS